MPLKTNSDDKFVALLTMVDKKLTTLGSNDQKSNTGAKFSKDQYKELDELIKMEDLKMEKSPSIEGKASFFKILYTYI